MKTLHTTLLATLAALSLGVAAQAQNQAQNQTQVQPRHERQWQAPTPEQRAEFAARRAERFAKRTQQLHDELAITAGQESAWKAFAASMQPAARTPHADRAAWASLSAPERMAKMIEMQKQRTAAMEGRLGALNSFYSVLTPEQKKVFDAKATRMQARWGGHGRRHGGQREHAGQGQRAQG